MTVNRDKPTVYSRRLFSWLGLRARNRNGLRAAVVHGELTRRSLKLREHANLNLDETLRRVSSRPEGLTEAEAARRMVSP
jgi:hypothetical protein